MDSGSDRCICIAVRPSATGGYLTDSPVLVFVGCVPTFSLCLEENLNMNNCSNYDVCTSKIEEVGYLYILPCICGIGIFSNSLILFVFSKSQFNSKMTSSTLTYLTALALADGLSCLFTLPETFIRCVDTMNKNVQQFYNFYEEYIYYPVCGAVVTTSVWITLVLTVERFTFVTKNSGEVTGQSSMRSTKGAICICIGTLVLSISTYIPTFFFYDVNDEIELVESKFAESLGYEIYSWIRMFVTVLIPILVVTALNIALIRITWASSERCKVHVYPIALYTRRVKAQRKMTAMLLSISFTFVVCHVLKPLLNSRVHNTFFGNLCSTETAEFEQLRMFVISLEMVSCASNFIAYRVFNPHFVSTFKIVCKLNKAQVFPDVQTLDNAPKDTDSTQIRTVS